MEPKRIKLVADAAPFKVKGFKPKNGVVVKNKVYPVFVRKYKDKIWYKAKPQALTSRDIHLIMKGSNPDKDVLAGVFQTQGEANKFYQAIDLPAEEDL